MHSATQKKKAELLREKLSELWAAQLDLGPCAKEQEDAQTRQVILDWMREELGIKADDESYPVTDTFDFSQPPHQ